MKSFKKGTFSSLLVANLFLFASAYPRGPCGTCGDSQPPPPPPPPPAPSSSGYPPSGGTGSSDAQSFGPFGGAGGGVSTIPTDSSSSGASGGACQVVESSPGNYKVTCAPPTSSVQTEHILWLTSDGSSSQVVDIVVPNYKINELIKAGFKAGAQGGSQINVLLKKPEQSVDAQVDKPKLTQGPPKVKVEYEPTQKQTIHFPNDKQYSPLTGPILPPLAGGSGSTGGPAVTSANGRFQRQAFQQRRYF